MIIARVSFPCSFTRKGKLGEGSSDSVLILERSLDQTHTTPSTVGKALMRPAI